MKQCKWCTPNGSDGVLCCAKKPGHDGPHATSYAVHPNGRPDAPGIVWMNAKESKRYLKRAAETYVDWRGRS